MVAILHSLLSEKLREYLSHTWLFILVCFVDYVGDSDDDDDDDDDCDDDDDDDCDDDEDSDECDRRRLHCRRRSEYSCKQCGRLPRVFCSTFELRLLLFFFFTDLERLLMGHRGRRREYANYGQFLEIFSAYFAQVLNTPLFFADLRGQ
jgi:hypothetical protein